MVKVKAKWLDGVGFEANVRHFPPVVVDEPPEFHGDDRGFSSVEYLLVGIAGCLGSSLAYCFRNLQVELKSMEIDVDGKLHHPEPGHPLRVVKIEATMDVEVAPDQDEEMVELCLEKFRKYCVVTQSVVQGIPADVKVNVK